MCLTHKELVQQFKNVACGTHCFGGMLGANRLGLIEVKRELTRRCVGLNRALQGGLVVAAHDRPFRELMFSRRRAIRRFSNRSNS